MYNPNQDELEILKFWKEKKIFEKTLAKKSPKGNFVFFEGPPTANGKPGLHHVEARAFKDMICRYRTMRGYFVSRKSGWDTHGLPVELQIEKELKISNKLQIEKYGIREFNQKCKESVWYYKKEWEKLTERIGYWLDLKNPYITYKNSYIESLWWIIKQIWKKGLLYEGHKIVPLCPRCGTTLSSHEVAQGYKSIEENSIFVKFNLRETGNLNIQKKLPVYVLSWTTTPWTLPGNVALAVGENIDYVVGKQEKEYFILAKVLADKVLNGDYKIEAEFKGKDLIGLEYNPLFPDYLEAGDKKAWYVTAADFVSTEEGTGVVHIAMMYGEDDYNLGKKAGLPNVHTVDENGLFLPSVKKWANKFVKSVEPEIIEDLKKRGLLYKVLPYTHDYPFCWRCNTPLLYYAKLSWFIKMSDLKIKKKLIDNNQKINWVPDYIKEGRFGEWLNEVKDWALSRERYWGTPLPIWRCACGEIKVVGSIEELEKLTQKNLKDLDLHRSSMDEITFPCKKCGKEMHRILEVLDCWFDSGSMPFAQWHYPFENKEKIDAGEQFPADFIAEAVDQTRGWFYTLLAVATLLDHSTPYKNVICLGHLCDAKGEKMSKSKGNIVKPWDVINQFGVDAIRWYFYTINQPGDTKNFNLADVETVVKKFFLILSNILNFYHLYSKGVQIPSSQKTVHVLDKWILAKLNLVIKETTKKLDTYDVVDAARGIAEFVNDLSTWWLRRSRARFKSDLPEEKNQALNTLYLALNTLSKLLAPFTPFMAEKAYRSLADSSQPTKFKVSVHLEEWPEVNEDLIDQKILEEMRMVREVTRLSLEARARVGIPVRQTLSRLTVNQKLATKEEYQALLKEELNIEEVVVNINQSEKVVLDTTITPELKEKGSVRELIRQINQLRKEAGLTIQDRVNIYLDSQYNDLLKIFNKCQEEIKTNTLAQTLEFKYRQVKWQKEVRVGEKKVWVGIKK